MRIEKIQLMKSGAVAIKYGVSDDNEGFTKIDARFSEPPEAAFRNAMDKLAKHVIEICEFPDLELKKISPHTVTFSYSGESERMSAFISVDRVLKNSTSVMLINTPQRHEPEGENSQDKSVLSKQCCKDLNQLKNEAKKYIDGMRHQKKLNI